MSDETFNAWSTKEKFILACCVSRSGDQNWLSVSRTIKLINEACGDTDNRSPDWYAQKNCAIKYNELLNTASSIKRKSRGASSESVNIETPTEQILRKLTFSRIEELNRSIEAEREKFKKLKADLLKIQSGKIDEDLPGIWEAIQSGQAIPLEKLIADENCEADVKPCIKKVEPTSEAAAITPHTSRPQRATKETEKFKSYIEQRQKHTAKYQNNQSTASAASSTTTITTPIVTPLITPIPTPISTPISTPITTPIATPIITPILQKQAPAVVVTTVTPTSSLSTILVSSSNPLKSTIVGPSPAQVQNMTIRTEANLAPPRGLLITKPDTNKPLESPTTPSNKTAPTTPSNKTAPTTPSNKKGDSFLSSLLSAPANDIKAKVNEITEVLKEPIKNPHHITKESYEAYLKAQPNTPKSNAPMLAKLLEGNGAVVSTVTASSTQVVKSSSSIPTQGLLKVSPTKLPSEARKTPTKVSTPEDKKITQPNVNKPTATITPQVSKVAIKLKESKEKLNVPKEDSKTIVKKSPIKNKEEPKKADPKSIEKVLEKISKSKKIENVVSKLNDSLKKSPPMKKEQIVKEEKPVEAVKPVEAAKPVEAVKLVKHVQQKTKEQEKVVVADKMVNDETDSQSTELSEEPIEEPPKKKRVVESIIDGTSSSQEQPLLEPSPKLKRKGKGRSRSGSKKKSNSHSTSSLNLEILVGDDELSQSTDHDVSTESKDITSEFDMSDDIVDKKFHTPLTPSLASPASPALSIGSNSDPELAQQQRAWRKSIMLVWKAAASHKYANVFLHPVTDEEAPGYSSIIFKPMDLSLIKKNIETGVTITTTEFQRDIMLMFQNALMYNRKEHDVYRMAQEMRDDVMEQIQSFVSTQLMVQTTTEQRDSKLLRGKPEVPGHTRQSSKSGFTFLSL